MSTRMEQSPKSDIRDSKSGRLCESPGPNSDFGARISFGLRISVFGFLIALSTFNLQLSTTFAQGTAFTYQGRLNDGGGPVHGTYDFRFKLFSDAPGDTQLGNTALTNGIIVTNGLFTTAIDFGSGIFTGSNLWLEVSVRTNGAVSYTSLSPLQALTPAPYAVFAGGASNVLGVLPSGGLSGTYSSPITFNNPGDSFSGSFGGDGGGLTNVNAATLGGVGTNGFWRTSGNGGTTAGANFLGTSDTEALELHVNGGRALRLEPNVSGAPNMIGGAAVNYVSNTVVGATIAGGGAANFNGVASSNSVTAIFGTVGGGSANVVANSYSTVAGGTTNSSSGLASTVGGGRQNSAAGDYASVAGGTVNNASGTEAYVGGGSANNATSDNTTIGGGYFNFATTFNSTIGGGANNSANGYDSTIGGGYQNSTAGNFFGAATVGGGYANQAAIDLATVGGGYNNIASGYGAVIAGGGYDSGTLSGNRASGNASTIAGGIGNQATNIYATVGGGQSNTAGGHGSTVAGGSQNQATGNMTLVCGGNNNIASGNNAAVVAGNNCTASGDFSLAAGNGAQAVNSGSWVWSDASGGSYSSDRNNEFKVRAAGGVFLDVSASHGLNPAALRVNSTSADGVGIFVAQTSSDATAVFTAAGTGNIIKGFGASGEVFDVVNTGDVYAHGVLLTSDRNAKEHFSDVSATGILDKVMSLPITQWNFKGDSAGQKHVGPMAQDFHAAFGLNGGDDKHISATDEGGVALAAIQGLNQKLAERDAEIRELQQSVAELKTLMAHMAPPQTK